jgi:hypothetical protein
LDISLDSTPYPISGILRDRRQSKAESVIKVFPLVHCVPMIITSSLFIRFEYMSNEWKVDNVNYEFGIASFLRCNASVVKNTVFQVVPVYQHRLTETWLMFKIHNS